MTGSTYNHIQRKRLICRPIFKEYRPRFWSELGQTQDCRQPHSEKSGAKKVPQRSHFGKQFLFAKRSHFSLKRANSLLTLCTCTVNTFLNFWHWAVLAHLFFWVQPSMRANWLRFCHLSSWLVFLVDKSRPVNIESLLDVTRWVHEFTLGEEEERERQQVQTWKGHGYHHWPNSSYY